MALSKIRELREKRGRLVAEAPALLPANGGIPEETRKKFDLIMLEVDQLKSDIDREERKAEADAADAETRVTRRPPEAQIGNGYDEALSSNAERRFERAFKNYLHRGLYADHFGFPGLTPEDLAVMQERRDMGTGGGNALDGMGGGFFVPVGFVNQVETALKYYSGVLQVASILDTATGQPLPYPTANDTGVKGELVSEGASVSSADVNLSNIVLGAYKFSTKLVKVSLELAQDSAFDLSVWLPARFGERLGRILNEKFTKGLGSGSSEPLGIITAATASGQTIIGDDNASGPNPATEIGYTDLLNLEHSVDLAYRPGAGWMMHDSTLRFLKTLRDKYGRPLWQPGLTSGAPDTLLGYRYTLNNSMDELGAGKKPLLFGALSKFLVRRVKELAVIRLVERFADTGQLGFLGFARYDSALLDGGTNPVKYAVMHS